MGTNSSQAPISLNSTAEVIGDHPEYMSVVSFNVNTPDQ